ncbi:hypothetical protein [Aquimarina mytili]|uniref:Uncharacterized protein n=1 Tax=Aquimarina mytili TaxID=874423 RepID=A0A937D647_9FLAO|nr:hypothetical protein [Aquimarina mytili]MBL0683979.1 hypothetical protein [Aquimarina mytili]
MKIKKAFKDLKNKRVQLAKENEYFKVIGNASTLDQNTLTSPLGKKKCVYYQVHITQRIGNALKTIVKEEKCVDFIVESYREKAIIKADVDTMHKKVHLIEHLKQQSNIKMTASKEFEDYLNSYGKSTKNTVNTIRYDEACIEIGQKIAVAGIAHWIESDHKLDQYSSKNLQISGDKNKKLLITNDSRVF